MTASGIKIIRLEIFKNTKGDVLKYVSRKNSFFKKFGEVYFSEIHKNKTKGWNLHKKNTCLITVPYGKVQFTFIEKGKTLKKKIIIGKKNYKLVIIPPNFWFSFRSLTKTSLVANCIDNPHSANETKKISRLNNISIK